MTGSSIPNVVILVVITNCSREDPASPGTAPDPTAEARTRQEHAQADTGQSPDPQSSGTPGDGEE